MPFALIVDESLASGARLKQCLFRRGIQSERVASVAEALTAIDRSIPDLVFMADLLPGKPGFAAAQKLKLGSRTAQIPIVMYSPAVEKVYVGQARALGAEDFLFKPVRQAAVDAVLERLRRAGKLFDADSTPIAASLKPAPKLQGWNLLPWALCSVMMVVGSYAVFEKSQASIQHKKMLDAVQSAMNFSGYYDFDELPYGLEKQQRIRALLEQLLESGFSGELQVVEYRGEFCMVSDVVDGGRNYLIEPKSDIALSDCFTRDSAPILDYPMVDKIRDEFRSSLLEMIAERDANIELVFRQGHATEQPYSYPDEHAYIVGSREWNETAALNNQIQVLIKEG